MKNQPNITDPETSDDAPKIYYYGVLPLGEGNETRYIKCLYARLDGKKYIPIKGSALTYSSSPSGGKIEIQLIQLAIDELGAITNADTHPLIPIMDSAIVTNGEYFSPGDKNPEKTVPVKPDKKGIIKIHVPYGESRAFALHFTQIVNNKVQLWTTSDPEIKQDTGA